MSQAHVVALWSRASSDAALQARIVEIQTRTSAGERASAMVDLARAEGFVFSAADYQAALQQQLVQPFRDPDELSDEALDKVAGGWGDPHVRDTRQSIASVDIGAVKGNISHE